MAIKRITTNLIKDSDIATVDIANNAITAAKITNGNITTAKLADLSVTAGKLAGTLDLTGKTITVATATTGDSDTSPASTAFVQQEIAALVDSSPSSLNTLNELAAALGDDASFSTTVTNSIALKAPLDSPVFSSTYTSGQDETLAEFRRDGGAVAAKIIYADATTDMEFGTTTSHALSFITGDTRRVTINNLGKVGIGTTNPLALLTISNSGGPGFEFSPGVTNFGVANTNYIASYDRSASTYRDISFDMGGTESNAIRFKTGGRVGIGTSSPGFPLHVNSSSTDVAKFQTSGAYTYTRFQNSSKTWALSIGSDFGFYDEAASATRMIIDSSGNILIGGFTGTTTGGSGARWINLDTPSSNSYSSGLLYKINGAIKAYHYVENDMIMHQTTSGVGQKFYAGTDVAMTINSSGNVGIGTNSPKTLSGQKSLSISAAVPRIDFKVGDVFKHHILAEAEYMSISADADNNQSNSRVIIEADNAAVARFDSDGIKFGSDTAAANALDDYEEGTYTATISCASGSISLNTSFDELRYTKIGKLVHVQGRLACNGVSNPTGATNLNLPFTSTNDTNKSGMADNVITGYFNGSAVTNGIYTVYGNIDESSSNCRLFIMIIPATYNLGDNYMAGGSDLYVNFTYTAA